MFVGYKKRNQLLRMWSCSIITTPNFFHTFFWNLEVWIKVLIIFFIDFYYKVIIHYLCISHYLTILLSFTFNYTPLPYCVIDSLFSSASLPMCLLIPVLRMKHNEIFGGCCHWSAPSKICFLLEIHFDYHFKLYFIYSCYVI